MKLPSAAQLVATSIEETFSYYAFPSEHQRSLRTNNPLERVMREIRRRTRVVGAFPGRQQRVDPRGGKIAPHRRHALGQTPVPRHEPPQTLDENANGNGTNPKPSAEPAAMRA
jgi:hypothetical protein